MTSSWQKIVDEYNEMCGVERDLIVALRLCVEQLARFDGDSREWREANDFARAALAKADAIANTR